MTIKIKNNLNKPCIISCKKCKLSKYCKNPQYYNYSKEGTRILKKQLSKLINIPTRLEKLGKTKIKTSFNGGLPKFIPQIRLNDERTFYWLKDPLLKEAFNTVIIRYDDVGTSMNFINKIWITS